MIHGAKKGQKQPRQPHIAKDDLVSTSYFKGLYGLAEGEIAGLADGGKSIRLDGTPLINANGQPNFKGVTWDFRTGTLDQEHIAGFSAVENERNVGVELRHDRPYVQMINNVSLSAVRLRLNFNALREQKNNGDITGYAIEYAIDVQTDGGAFTQVLSNTVRGKASQGFKKSHRIELPKATKNWTIRVRRITPNRDSDLIADTVSIDAITEIIDAKLRYPATAMLGLTYDASTFSNIAKLAVRLKGKLIKVPTNYNPVARTYSGLWDGTFKLAYSNNPAWVLYDICTHKRYGLGERLSNMVDKWRLYQIAQYCDEPVDDGKGGKEPRFAINVYIQQDDDAYKVIQNIASVFRGLSYWDGTQVIVDSDTPKDPVYTFSAANVVGGEFTQAGTRARDRRTVVRVAWDNPDNGYKTEYYPARDEQGIARYGIRVLDISAFGCTSLSQAQRAGQWALKSEQLETRTVSFKTGLQGFIPQVGQIINIADNVFAGRAISGRVVSHNAQSITLDRTAGKVGDSIVIGKETAKITRVDGQVITTDKALTINDDAVWAIVSDDLKLMQFRILTIAQNDDATFSITALQYERQKYDAIDSGAVITPKPITTLTATPITAPSSVTISQSVRTHQNQSVTTMTINWTQVQGAVAYQVRWRKDDGNWQNMPKMGGQSVDIDGVYSGNYIAEVQAIDAFDNESLATSSTLTTIAGKVGKPPRLARLTATGKLFGMDLAWSFNAGSGDTNYTEIQVSPDGVSNIATLGTFAYPTDKHTINGLQGNLTQFYRARIVDKLGNMSDWTAWTSGKTEAQADKVLNLLQGQITASQLHQDLSTPIGKIGTLETGLASARFDINKAIADMGTERNRISQAIADIDVLRLSDNAKTAEIANLKQTVGGHTSSIRDLAVTTGDLSQKYTQLKSASDNANAEITSIKQTQNGQATQISTLGSRFDSLSVGGRNLILNSKQTLTVPAGGASNKESQQIRMSVANIDWTTVKQLTLSVDVKHADDLVRAGSRWWRIALELAVLHTDGTSSWPKAIITAPVNQAFNGRISSVWTVNKPISRINYGVIFAQNIDSNSEIVVSQPKLEIGNVATDWTPAPEDIDAKFTQTNANISTLQQTVTNADQALSQRIDALDASYKQADTTLNASITAEQTARTSADTALSQRITALDSAYKSADNALSARVATAEQSITTANQAIAQTQQTLTAKIDGLSVGGRNYLTKASFGIWRDGTWRDYRFVISDKNLASPRFTRAEAIEQGADVVFSFKIAKKSGRITSIGGHTHSLSHHQIYIDSVLVGNDFNAGVAYPDDLAVHHIVIKAKDHFATGSNDKALYIQPNRGSNGYADVYSCEIWDCKLEKGNVATDWTPAPEDVDSQFVQTNANISTLQQTVTNADQALSQRIDTLDASYKQADTTLNASITAEVQARTSADNALSQRITALDSAYKSADNALSARVATAEQSITTANQAIAQTQQTLTARIDSLSVGGRNLILNSKQTLTVPAGGASNKESQQIRMSVANIDWTTVKQLTLSVDVKHADDLVRAGSRWWRIALELAVLHTDGTSSWPKAIITAPVNQAFNGRISSVWTVNKPISRINYGVIFAQNIDSNSEIVVSQPKLEIGNVATDWTPAPEDVDSATSAVQANLDEFKTAQVSKDNATAQSISTLQTTVNGQTASIQQHSQSINGLSAQWTLKAESNGIVSGIGLASSNGVSDFAVRANKFYVVPPTGTTKRPLFSVLTTATMINGVSVPAGVYLSDGYIQNGTITNAKIANGAITTAKIGNAQIGNAQIANGAITTAKIGNAQIGNAQIANGAITTAKIGTAQVDTLQIKGEAVVIPRLQYSQLQEFYEIDTEVEINRVSLNAQGGAVSISFGFERLEFKARNLSSNDGVVKMRIKRGSTVIRYKEFAIDPTTIQNGDGYRTIGRGSYGQTIFLTFLDVPPLGEQVYTVTLESRRLNDGLSSRDRAAHPVRVHERSLHIMGVKR